VHFPYFGLTLEFTDEELIDLSVAALFVHVGYTVLPKDEFKSFLKSQNFNHPAMKKHLEVFLNVTLDSPYLRRKSIIHGVLDHHEFYNGKGYPNGKKGEEISLFGRILHIAHAYDSMVGGYDYTIGVAPLQAVKLVFENEDGMFDYNILNIFMYRTTYFKLGETMVLPNGKNGKIVGFENYVKNPHLPIVELESGRTVNLLHESIPDA
jgi:HD-GYP domain-containing protein (c-di-GMP phosphodiesterase class II)